MEEMTRQHAEYRLFKENLDCGQTVFAHFAEELDLDEETALKIAAGFGGGMHRGEVCGCVSGALMALGLKYGFCDGNDTVGKGIMNEKADLFMRRFEEECGSLLCRGLLGVDTGTAQGKMAAGEIIPLRCPDFVTAACRILDELLEE